MANSTMQDLLNAYTGKIKVDPRVFSQDVVSQNEFSRPFDAWVNNMVNQYMLPEFNRYTYNPQMEQLNSQLFNINQDTGLSGAWRNAGSRAALNEAAESAIRQQEQMTRGFNDQVLQVRDAFKQSWSDPLYRNRMEEFYNAPWRNLDTGNNAPKFTPDDPRLQGFNPNPTAAGQTPTPQTGGQSAFMGKPLPNQYGMNFGGQGGGQIRPAVIRPGGKPQQESYDMGGNRRNLLSQYLTRPQVSNANSFNILSNS